MVYSWHYMSVWVFQRGWGREFSAPQNHPSGPRLTEVYHHLPHEVSVFTRQERKPQEGLTWLSNALTGR